MSYLNKKSLQDITIDASTSHIERGPDGISREITRAFKRRVAVKSVSAGTRFLHPLIDSTVYMTIIFSLSTLTFVHPLFILVLFPGAYLIAPLYYVIMESRFQQTIGKMITGHVVINEFAERPTIGEVVVRTLVRAVPFEAFSCTDSPSRGWHDKWSKTYVVSKEEAERLKAIVAQHNVDNVFMKE